MNDDKRIRSWELEDSRALKDLDRRTENKELTQNES